jgi:hypothetical protein
MGKMPCRQPVSLGGGAVAVGSRQNGARRRQQFPVRVEGKGPKTFQLAGGESYEDGVRPRPAEGATRPLKKTPLNVAVTEFALADDAWRS